MLVVPLTSDADAWADPPTASVVIVSAGRPDHLRRSVLSILQQDHPALEIVVVADEPGLAEIAAVPQRARIKTEVFEGNNISEARNIGVALAGGKVVLFLDDDAVAEPTWARRLCAAFLNPRVVAATGQTLGRNGLSEQWGATRVDQMGQDWPLSVPLDQISLHDAPAGGAVKTVGTNAAFRRSILVSLRGFDARFRYFLDDADLNLRMARAGGQTAIVPTARVLHGYAANATRRADRAPRDLFEIGASVACFCRAHAPKRESEARERFRADQLRRAHGYLVTGALEPRDIHRLMASFDRGLEAGRRRVARFDKLPEPPPHHPIDPVATTRPHTVFACRAWGYGTARRAALQHGQSGGGATLLRVGPGFRRHRVFFGDSAIWEQWGGRFGRVHREQTPLIWANFRQYVANQTRRIAENRSPLPHKRRSVTAGEEIW